MKPIVTISNTGGIILNEACVNSLKAERGHTYGLRRCYDPNRARFALVTGSDLDNGRMLHYYNKRLLQFNDITNAIKVFEDFPSLVVGRKVHLELVPEPFIEGDVTYYELVNPSQS